MKPILRSGLLSMALCAPGALAETPPETDPSIETAENGAAGEGYPDPGGGGEVPAAEPDPGPPADGVEPGVDDPLREPSFGRPERTDPGITRGPTPCPTGIAALVPAAGLGRTTKVQPLLLWHLEEATHCRVDFVLNDPRRTTPLVDRVLEGPHAAGFHGVSLQELGVSLERGVVYTWFVQVVPDPEARSRDVFAGGTIAVVEASGADTGTTWYDTVARRYERLRSDPGDAGARGELASLLAAEGLGTVAMELGPPPGGPEEAAPRTPDVAADRSP